MPGTVVMTNRQRVRAGITILDEDGQPYPTIPPTMTVQFVSEDPTVAPFVVGPDGMNGFILSGRVGSTRIVVRVTMPDGQELVDSLTVIVENSLVGAVNFTVGSPESE